MFDVKDPPRLILVSMPSLADCFERLAGCVGSLCSVLMFDFKGLSRLMLVSMP